MKRSVDGECGERDAEIVVVEKFATTD